MVLQDLPAGSVSICLQVALTEDRGRKRRRKSKVRTLQCTTQERSNLYERSSGCNGSGAKEPG